MICKHIQSVNKTKYSRNSHDQNSTLNTNSFTKLAHRSKQSRSFHGPAAIQHNCIRSSDIALITIVRCHSLTRTQTYNCAYSYRATNTLFSRCHADHQHFICFLLRRICWFFNYIFFDGIVRFVQESNLNAFHIVWLALYIRIYKYAGSYFQWMVGAHALRIHRTHVLVCVSACTLHGQRC